MKYAKIANLDPLLKFYLDNGIISLDDVRNSNLEVLMSNVLKKIHKYKITRGSDGRWSTYIPDQTTASGRRLVRKKSQTELHKYLLAFYQIQEDSSRMLILWRNLKLRVVPNNPKRLDIK